MILTQEAIDIISPHHQRTSCNDDNLNNAYGGWKKSYGYDSKTGKKNISYPGCIRCYLMHNIGYESLNLEFEIECYIGRWKDPDERRD